MYYQNIRSLNNKTLDVTSSTTIDEYNILLFTETWLKNDVSSNELKLIIAFIDVIVQKIPVHMIVEVE